MSTQTAEEPLEVSSEPAPLPPNNIILKGEYVTLTALAKDDMPKLWNNLDVKNNSHIWDYLRVPCPENDVQLWDTFSVPDFILYAIYGNPKRLSPTAETESDEKEYKHDELLGSISYHDINAAYRTLEIGRVIFGPALQRTAAATEVNYLMLKLAIEGIGNINGTSNKILSPPYRRVLWKCNKLNVKSRRAAERMGYVYEGTLRNHMIVKGKSRDSDMLSIIESEWPAVKAVLEAWLKVENFDEGGKQRRGLDEIREMHSSRT